VTSESVKLSILRCPLFYENLKVFSESIRKQDVIELPIADNAKFPMLSMADAASAITTLLTTCCKSTTPKTEEQIFTLTSRDVITPNDIVTAMSKQFKKEIKFKRVSTQDFLKVRTTQSLPHNRFIVSFAAAVLEEFAFLDGNCYGGDIHSNWRWSPKENDYWSFQTTHRT